MRDDYVPTPGVAAYPVKPDCPAPRHNTLNAARGVRSYSNKFQHRQVTGFPKCVCDRAVQLNDAFLARRRAMHGRRLETFTPERTVTESERARRAELLTTLAEMPRPAVPTPDFVGAGAACATEAGIVAMDNYIDSPKTPWAVDMARRLCNDKCPIKDACGAWVIASERYAGSWGGMYAGLTPRERQDAVIAAYESRSQSAV